MAMFLISMSVLKMGAKIRPIVHIFATLINS
jgi:hypothetical protein